MPEEVDKGGGRFHMQASCHPIGRFWADKKRKKRAIAVFTPLFVIVIVLAVAFSLRTALAASFTSDLGPLVQDVQITDALGSPVSGSYVLGANYRIKINFRENSSYQLVANSQNELTYQLPPEIKIVSPVTDKPIYAAAPNDQNELGAYSIGQDGLVTVTLFDVDDTGAATPGTPLFENYIDTFFNLSVDAQFSNTGDNVQIKFGDTVTIPVTITDKPTQAALSITKSAAPATYNPDRNDTGTTAGSDDFDPKVNGNYVITYTSVITATTGTVTNLTFHDDAVGFSWIPDKSWLESVQVSINGGAATTYALATSAQGTNTPNTYYWISATKGTYNDPVSDPNSGFYLVFPDGTELSEGQNITVTYVIDANKMVLASGTDPYHQLYGYYLHNNAFASGLDGVGHALDVNAQLAVYLPGRNYTSKSGTLSSDGKTINWSATAGDGIEPLTGKTIYDSLNENGTASSTMSFSTPVTIKLYGADHTTQIGSDVVLAMPTGQSFTYDVTQSGAYYADITYTVSVTDLTTSYYSNIIGVTVNGKNYGNTGTITNPNADMKITKTAFVTEVDGYKAIQWTVKWSIPASYYGHSVYLTDRLQGAAAGYTNIPQHLTVSVVSGGVDLGAIASSDATYGWWTAPYSASQPSTFCFYFSPGGTGYASTIPHNGDYYDPQIDAESLFPFENGGDVTVTYYTMLEGPNTSTLTDAGQGGDTYGKTGDTLLAAVMDPTLTGYPKDVENIATIWGHITSDKTGYDFVGVTAPIAKTGTPNSDGSSVDYRVTINSLAPSYTSEIGSSFDMGDDPVFTDTFDSNTLEYVKNSFYILTYPNITGGCYFGPYDTNKQDQLINGASLDNFIKDNGNGTSTITIHLKDLMQITGPTTDYDNYATAPPWIGPPTGVNVYPANPAAPANWWNAENLWTSQPMIRVFYRLQLKSDAGPGTHEIKNSASINKDWTANNTTSIGHEVVTKTMTKDETTGNSVNTQIVINPTGETIAPENADGLYEAKDTMSGALTLYLSSIKVEKQDPVGGAWQTVTLNSNYGEAWSYLFSDADNSIKFTFPDKTPIRITYSARVAGNLGDTVDDVSNSITVAVNYSASDSVNFVVTGSNAGAGGSRLPVTLFKRDVANSDLGLAGARFALYINADYPTLPTAPSGIDGSVNIPSVGGQAFYYVTSGYTDGNGQLIFDDQHLSYSTGAVYALVELKAPDGYFLPLDPVTLFALQNQDFSAFAPKPVTVISDYITVTNASGVVLPDAGGSGITPYLIGAITLTVLLIAALSGTLITRRRRRKICLTNT